MLFVNTDCLSKKDAKILKAQIEQQAKERRMLEIDYEAKLKADMVAMLEEIKLKITEKSYYDTTIIGNYEDEVRINLVELDDVNEIIQDKINTLEVEDGNVD